MNIGKLGHGFLQDIKKFSDTGKLNHVDTIVTNTDGKRYTEKINELGERVISVEETTGLGFCPDLQPDYEVGIAMEKLLISSVDVAYDMSCLKKHAVTHILNVAADLPNAFKSDDNFKYMNVEMYDDLDEVIMNHYGICEKFIDEALSQPDNTVLVHCHAGRSRSVSIAIAYVMHKQRIPFLKALDHIKKTRASADPNTAFRYQLQRLEKILNII